ncbi:MAG: hypothetical protein A3K19_27625 [Lentisphaerae bacterium RIFOXYB12_FULL_65_16]|nr:MAG: hypothetical protein A3K18_24995 [Lentisphaerae bacterium RIFOXYA12_64_32]OGV86074.1 MAG: hypothetical protein A3K19_27625 [Lentisphaerae bacterium RIFOXYB12_FULL_65_16]
MRKNLRCVACLGVCVLLLTLVASGATSASARSAPAKPADPQSRGLQMAKSISTITGVAISPLLGVGAVGAYDYFSTAPEMRNTLPWYGNPVFWVPALLLVAAVAGKDAFGTVVPPGLKKPLDVAETIENKVSGLVAAGAFVPMVASVFPMTLGGDAPTAAATQSVCLAGMAAFDGHGILNVLTVPLALVAYALVWLVSHTINVLILISPFGVVDAALKSARTFLLALLTGVSFINPWAGALLSLVIIVIAYLVAGWSFRLMVYGTIYVWDFVTLRQRRFTPAANANWMFTAREIDGVPIRTYGKLVRNEQGNLTFAYRPWLVLAPRNLSLAEGRYAIGRGLFCPELMLVAKETNQLQATLVMPPRYRSHEEEVAGAYGLTEVRDIGLLRGLKAMWSWLRHLFGGARPETAPAAAA